MLKTISTLALVPVIMTVIPLFKHDAWWVRIFDFPRLQIAALLLVCLVALVAYRPPFNSFAGFAASLTLIALAVQVFQIVPYTPLWKRQVVEAQGGLPTIKLLVSNVLMDNRKAEGLHAHIEQQDADLIVLNEPDAWWEDQMRQHEADYPHVMRAASDNTYGMLLYSRLPILEPEILELLEEGVPSFHLFVEVAGQRVRLHLIHPKPPFPKEAMDTTERDAEIVLVGKMAEDEDGPVIVAGDLNDVAWSHSTRLFQRISSLLDPRRGRALLNTFHADYFIARWPLDHVFISDHFRLVDMARLSGYGSDHFPIVVEFELAPAPDPENDGLDADAEDHEEADEIIEKGLQKQNGGPENLDDD